MQDFTFQINYDEESYGVFSYEGDEEDIIIPKTFGGKSVTVLFDKLFAGHTEIRSIQFPDTITDFGEFLFDGCENLRQMQLPPSLKYLWGYTFVRCGIEEIILPDGIGSIPPFAFKDCKSLRKVICGKDMKKINAWAFSGCSNELELICGEDVNVSPDAFRTPDIG